MRASLVFAVLVISAGAAHANAFQHVTVQRTDAAPDAVIDCYVWQEQPDYNGGGSDTLYIGLVGASDKMIFVRFDTGAVPAGARVVSATMTLKTTSNGGTPIDVRSVTQKWTELEPTWGTFSDKTRPGTEATFTPAEGTVSVDLTQLVQSWVADPTNNFGLALTQATMTASSTFASSDWTVVSERPRLDIVFDQPPPQGALVTDLPPTLEASCEVPLAYSLRAHVPSGRFELAGSKGAIGTDSGLFTWTPTRADRGVHSFAIKVDDAGRTGELQLDVNVQCTRGLGVGTGCSSVSGLSVLFALALLRRMHRERRSRGAAESARS